MEYKLKRYFDMKPMAQLGVFLWLTMACSQNNNDDFAKFDILFNDLHVDSLHIAVTTFAKKDRHKSAVKTVEWEGSFIPKSIRKQVSLRLDADRALGKMGMDAKKKIMAYLVGDTKGTIHLYCYDSTKDSLLLTLEVASRSYLEGAFEKTRNSWISDTDSNGSKDIATWEYLLDFELPNETGAKASVTKKFVHALKDTIFEYQNWPRGYLDGAVLKK